MGRSIILLFIAFLVGVLKGSGGNKMNEIRPHTNWATKIFMRARAFGVIENQSEYVKLFNVK